MLLLCTICKKKKKLSTKVYCIINIIDKVIIVYIDLNILLEFNKNKKKKRLKSSPKIPQNLLGEI